MSDDYIKDTYIYTTFDVAMYMVGLLNEKHISLDVLKVQTLLYITYGVYLCAYDERLLNEHPQVYYLGPLFPQLKEDIAKMDLYSVPTDFTGIDYIELKKIKNDPKLIDVLEFVIYHFAELTSYELCDLLRDRTVRGRWHVTEKISDLAITFRTRTYERRFRWSTLST